jgi:uncharacterized protein
MKKITLVTMLLVMILSFSICNLGATGVEISKGDITISYRSVSVFAPAVAQTSTGYRGVVSTITVTIHNGSTCSGRIFVETTPLTQIDMQGSARLAVTVASAITGIDISNYDFFFVIRTDSPVIGGPSAGAVMTVATIAALEDWDIDNKTMMTGMINPDGSIGPVGGIIAKLEAAYNVGATRFLIPKGQGTYTDIETVKIVKKIGNTQIIQITQRPVKRNVSDYAMENYGIEVMEVADINDALRYMTGHVFNISISDHPITTEDYIDSMKPLASSLLEEANQSYINASKEYNTTDVPNQYPFYYDNQIKEMLKESKDALDVAKSSYDDNLYYSSTSKSFLSLINSRFVRYACNYFKMHKEKREEYLQNIIDKCGSLVNEKGDLAKNAKINGITSMQCVGAAQKRAVDAKNQLESAVQSYENGDYLNSLYKLAYAIERAKSVGWWLNISNKFEEYGNVTNEILNEVGEKYIESAQQAIVYSSIILQEMGKSSDLLEDASNLLRNAKEEINEYPASALFEALEALAKANLALELAEGLDNAKLNRAKETANSAIIESRNLGIEPILAVSYYEYAETLANESAYNAIIYYKYANIIAGATRLIVNPPSPKESIYVGVPPVPERTMLPISVERNTIMLFYYMLLIATATIIIGLFIGIIIDRVSIKRSRGEIEYIPRSVREYYKKQKE